jgi:hypothetical protein
MVSGDGGERWQGAAGGRGKAFPRQVARVMESQQEATGGGFSQRERVMTGTIGIRPQAKCRSVIRGCKVGIRASRVGKRSQGPGGRGRCQSNSLAIKMDGESAPQPRDQAKDLIIWLQSRM